MVTIKDYAKKHGISYETVRRQVKQYAAELTGHTVQQGRTTFLDEIAEAFLDKHRNTNTVVLYDSTPADLIEQLKEENHNLYQQLAAAQARIIALQDTQRLLEAAKAENLRLEASHDEVEKRLCEATQRAEAAESAAAAYEQDMDQLRQDKAALERQVQELENRGFWARVFGRRS
jgi:predicted site-specific integrase-resolvase